MHDHAGRVREQFKRLTGEEPLLVRSPGRVNLIGEHTDYNLGFVLPAAIDRAITFAVAPRTDSRCLFTAADMSQSAECDLRDLRSSPQGWPNYLIGVLDQLQRMGLRLGGVHCVFGGDVPIGAGLSSSAAIEVGFAFALNEIFECGIDRLELVKLAQRAENEFVGVQCGIMDQFVNMFGEQNTVLRLDCSTLEYERVPIPSDAAIVLFNTQVSHSLATSVYNARRQDCAAGVHAVRQRVPGVASLRDVSRPMLEVSRRDMDPTVFRRCAYVVDENDRLLRGCALLAKGDIAGFGGLMFETHVGLSREYEVSCPELDALVLIVQGLEGVLGARMMGGGFGGCTVNIVRPDAIESVVQRIAAEFEKKFGRIPPAYVTAVSAGTHIIHERSRAEA